VANYILVKKNMHCSVKYKWFIGVRFLTVIEKPLLAAKSFIRRCSLDGETAVDATAGNGHDTLFLARLVGENGRVLTFDIQNEALETTRARLAEENLENRVALILSGHEYADQYLDGPVAAAMFNLGYLPGGDHSIVTSPKTTSTALRILAGQLKTQGIITIVMYSGHPGGSEEKAAVLDCCSQLPQKHFTVLSYELVNQANNPPSLLVIEKKEATGLKR